MKFLNRLKNKISILHHFSLAKKISKDSYFKNTLTLNEKEVAKTPKRTEIINYLLSRSSGDFYLEIGVRNPDDNFNHIKSNNKFSVDPGIEFEENPVDFKMTSDDFFVKLQDGEILKKDIKFDLIFIDGLHEAIQVDRDIKSAMQYIAEDGFIVLHDCNPLTEWHCRSTYEFAHSPAGKAWNGSTWKAFVKWRQEKSLFSCCIDSDWGVGIISKSQQVGTALQKSVDFYEYKEFAKERELFLGLISFEELQRRLQ